jgi:hypothetical protein
MPAPSVQLLAPHARALLFDPPVERDEALRRCALTPEDLALARRHRRSHNRLGFSVQLALVRDLGRPLRRDEAPPAAMVEAVADQLDIEPAVFALYARRDGTRREHAGEIAALLDLRGMHQADYRTSIRAAATCAAGTDRGEPIARAVIEDLKERRITVPAPALVERLALAGRAWARRQSHRDLARGLDDAQRARLEALLINRAEHGRTLHGWIGEAREGPTLKNLAGVTARLEVLRRTRIADERRRTVHGQPPPSGPRGMLVQRRSWDQRERGWRSWSGLRSRPRGGSRDDDLGRRWTVSEGGVRPDRVVVAAPAFDHDLCLS